MDDDPFNRQLLSAPLRQQGFETATACSGPELFEMLQLQRFDPILLDLILPELTGYEILERLRGNPETRHTPMIMISAMDDHQSVARCLELGADDYLTKPFNPTILEARLSASFARKQLHDQETHYRGQLEAEKRRVDELLHSVFPGRVVEQLKITRPIPPRQHAEVGVLVCDVVGFTAFCQEHPAQVGVRHLQEWVGELEGIAERHGLEKIKTMGDRFMATAGLNAAVAEPTLQCVRGGLEMVQRAPQLPAGWDVRVGIDLGPVLAGIIGMRQVLYDVWGEPVTRATLLSATGPPGSVCLSHAA